MKTLKEDISERDEKEKSKEKEKRTGRGEDEFAYRPVHRPLRFLFPV